jgi:hypothetical protein
MNLTLLEQPANHIGVFNPVVYKFRSNEVSPIINYTSFVAVYVSTTFQIALGENILIGNDSSATPYLGSHRVTQINTVIVDGVQKKRLVVSTLWTGNSPSVRVAPDAKQRFYLFGGFQGAGSSIKNYELRDIIQVSANPLNLEYTFGIQSFLKKYYILEAPTIGVDYNISFKYAVSNVNSLPTYVNTKNAYYGFKNPTTQEITDRMPLGDFPITFLDEATNGIIPSVFSEIETTENSVRNILIQDLPAIVYTDLEFNALPGQTYIITYQHSGVIASLNVDPVLPDWITILPSDNDQIKLQINTFTSNAGDYAAIDYSITDYLTLQFNNIVGCYSFQFKDGVDNIFLLEFCIAPVSFIRRMCKDRVLNFAYLNKSGGWNSIALECRYIGGRDFGQEKVITDSNNILKRINYKDVFDTYSLTAGLLSRRELDLVKELRSSIQVYLYDNETLAFDIPLVIDKGSFETYGNRFKITESTVSFSFKDARKVEVQTQ